MTTEPVPTDRLRGELHDFLNERDRLIKEWRAAVAVHDDNAQIDSLGDLCASEDRFVMALGSFIDQHIAAAFKIHAQSLRDVADRSSSS